ncbi:MAG: sensor histidine kinase [Bacteroidota bacterium]
MRQFNPPNKNYKRVLNALLASIGEAVIIVDPSGRRISNCNRAAEEMFGYPRDEMIGKKTKLLHIDEQHYKRFGEQAEAILAEGNTFRCEYQMKRNDGSIFDTFNTVTPVHEDLGWEAGVVSIIRDISERKNYQRQLEKNLQEKETLIKELHHRVKNNLNVIISLLDLQGDDITSQDSARQAFSKTRQRIYSMALVHEKLYHSTDLTEINISEYVTSMSQHLLNAMDIDHLINLRLDIDEILLDVNYAIPCGLIINELFTNALKHAFPNRHQGQIVISMHEDSPGQFQLIVQDNGIGLPDAMKVKESESLGLQIFQTLVGQLNGKWSVNTTDGTQFIITFPVKY